MAARPHPLWSVAAVLKEWALADTALAPPMAMTLVGSSVGTVLGGIFSDVAGRRPLIAASVALLGVFTGISILASAPWHLMVTMFLGGAAMGCFFSPGLALVTEIATPARRPLAISLSVASIPVGLTLSAAASAFVLPAYGWHTLFVLVALAAVPSFLLFAWFVPESPSFLATRPGREAEYREVMERLSLPPAEHAEEDAQAHLPLARRFAMLIAAAPAATIGLFVMFLGANMFGNAVLSWVPVAFSNLGFPLSFASGSLSGWTTATMLMTPLAGWLLGRYGFGVVGPASSLITTVALVLLGTFAAPGSNTTVLWAMLALGGLGTAGVVTSLYTLAAETFPPRMRGSGLGISDAVGRIGGVAGAFAGVYFLTAGGTRGFFYVLAAIMLFIALLMVFLHRGQARAKAVPAA